MDTPFDCNRIIETLIELYRHQGKSEIVNILSYSSPTIEETGYDNWNEGTYFYTLNLDVPIEIFSSIETRLKKIESEIESKIQVVLRSTGSSILNNVVIRPIMLDATGHNIKEEPNDRDIERIWRSGALRAFISHQHLDKENAANLKRQLATYQISAFVAHMDIEPTLVWQREIKKALNSMNIFIALLTSHFRDSKWTDQEVGYALAKGVLIIHVRDGQDPYGFIGETQSLSFSIENSEDLALAIVNVLLKIDSMKGRMRETLLVALENSDGFPVANSIMRTLKRLEGGLSEDEINRVRNAAKNNPQVGRAYTVTNYLENLSREKVTPF